DPAVDQDLRDDAADPVANDDRPPTERLDFRLDTDDDVGERQPGERRIGVGGPELRGRPVAPRPCRRDRMVAPLRKPGQPVFPAQRRHEEAVYEDDRCRRHLNLETAVWFWREGENRALSRA